MSHMLKFLRVAVALFILSGPVVSVPTTSASTYSASQPRVGDRDGDGIRDNVDQCPDQPEDLDGFQDEDGCPEL